MTEQEKPEVVKKPEVVEVPICPVCGSSELQGDDICENLKAEGKMRKDWPCLCAKMMTPMPDAESMAKLLSPVSYEIDESTIVACAKCHVMRFGTIRRTTAQLQIRVGPPGKSSQGLPFGAS